MHEEKSRTTRERVGAARETNNHSISVRARLLALEYEAVISLVKVTRTYRDWVKCHCPCEDHTDTHPSCKITQGNQQNWVVFCHRHECTEEDLLSTLEGLARDRGLFIETTAPRPVPPKPKPPPPPEKEVPRFGDFEHVRRYHRDNLEREYKQPIEAWHGFEYHGSDGQVIGSAIRFELDEGKKTFRPARVCGTSWEPLAPDAPRPLYRLPKITKASPHPIIVVEGEGCADALVSIGIETATTSWGGSNGGRQTDWAPLEDRFVLVLPDNDSSGMGYAEFVVKVCGRRARIGQLPGIEDMGPGADVVDWIAVRRKEGATDEVLRTQVLELYEESVPVERRIRLVKLSDVETKRQCWLWEGRIPMGRFTLLAGIPGDGKGLLCMDIARVVTKGDVWPDRPHETQPRGEVIWFESEDDLEMEMAWRAKAAGVDMGRFHAHDGMEGEGSTRLCLADDLPYVRNMLADMPDVRLVVFSTVTTYVQPGQSRLGKQEQIRATLEALNALAAEFNVAVLGITHLNQVQGASALESVKGFGDWVEVARSVMLMGAEEQGRKDSPRVLAQRKINSGEIANSLRFRLELVPTNHAGESFNLAKLKWDPGPCYVSAEELVRVIKGGHNEHNQTPGKQEKAAEAIDAELAARGGSGWATELRAAVEADGVTWNNVCEAQRTGKTKAVHGKVGLQTAWAETPEKLKDLQERQDDAG